jgi:amino acid adenylation domain-containing protein
LVGRVKEVSLGAYEHQDVPFEKLVEELQPERSLSRSPLFQVMFVFQNAPKVQLELPGLELELIAPESVTAKFNLLLTMEEPEEGLTGSLEYNTDLWDEDTIKRILTHYTNILQSAVENPRQSISSLALLSDEERRQVLFAFNQTARDYDCDKCIHEAIQQQAEITPGAVALLCDGQRLTYQQLNERANCLANYLIGSGVGPEHSVGVCLERSTQMVIALLGTLKAGAAYVPLDPAYPKQRLDYMLEDSRAKVLLSQRHLAEQFDGFAGKVICLDTDWTSIEAASEKNPASEAVADNLAYIIYTSGSTGRPKGVAITHRSAVTLAEWAKEEFSEEEMSGVLAATSICFDLSVFEIFVPLSCGGTIIVAENALELPELKESNDVRLINTVPSAMRELVSTTGLPESVITVNLAGEPLHNELVQQIYRQQQVKRVVNLYGPTEDTTYTTYEEAMKGANEEPTIGRPLANTEIYVLDKEMQPAPIGVMGEIYISGAGLARCYLGEAEKTAEKFVPNPYGARAGSRLYRTGDVGRYKADGRIEYKGRIDHQVKLRGYRIELGEIESLLVKHPAVQEAVAAVREDNEGYKRLVAYVVVDGEREAITAQLKSYLKGKVPEYMVPSLFVLLDQMPLTPNGKIDRNSLPAPHHHRDQSDPHFLSAHTSTQQKLGEIFGQMLGIKNVGIQDNFFELGGHSLLATQVVSRAKQAFEVELSLRSLFEKPTIEGLARQIEAVTKKGRNPVQQIRRVDRNQGHMLSFAQQRLWFLDQLEPGSATYNISAGLTVRGELDVRALEESFNRVVRRHEVLRARFYEEGGRAVQRIEEEMRIGLGVVDLREIVEHEREEEAERLMKEEAGRAFDLEAGGLLRARLMRVGDQEHVMVVVMHHIVSDGWSIEVLKRELMKVYEEEREGREGEEEELEVQYVDYAIWQREWLSGDTLEEELEYWIERLKGAPEEIELPTDRPRPAVQSMLGASIRFEIGEELTERVRKLGQEHSATLYMVLLAAFNALLHRYTSQQDIIIGTPLANRGHVNIEGLIGFFANTLAVRTDLSGNPSFHEILQRVRKTTLEAFDHQYMPFEKLVEVLQPNRDLSRSPIFQVTFALQENLVDTMHVGGLTVTSVELETGYTKYDLSMALQEKGSKVTGVIDYSTALFDEETIDRFAQYYRVLLEAATTDPYQPISELPLLNPDEREQLIDWNKTRRDYLNDRYAHQLIQARAQATPNAQAVTCTGAQLTFVELNARANQLARHLRQSGVGPEVKVALCVERGVEMVVGMLGVLKAGGAYMPIDATYPAARVRYILEDAKCPVMLTQQRLVEELPETPTKIVCLDSDWDLIATHDSEDFDGEVEPENLAYVIYTSGTAGKPKGVEIEHRGLRNLINWYIEEYNVQPSDRASQMASLGFDASVWETWPCLAAGASLHIVDEETRLTSWKLKKWLLDQSITISFMPTPLAELMIEEKWPATMELKKVQTGGDRLRKYPPADIGFELINHYGPTETTVCATRAVVTRTGKAERPPSIGKPIANTQIYLLDDQLGLAPVGIKGEMYIAGKGLARGYCNAPALTAEKFIPDLFSEEPGARLYRTGDLARYLPDGNIEFLGRIDQQVKIRGARMEPAEIEAQLSEHHAVQQAIVLTKQEATGEIRLIGYVAAGKQQVNAAQLRSHLKQRLPEYMVPSGFVILESLPLTPNGKIDRRALQELPLEDAQLDENYLAPKTAVEEIVAGIWSQLLGVEQAGANQSFFDLGGHSLLATQLVSRIRQSFGIEISVRELFEDPTINALARLVYSRLTVGAGEQTLAIRRRERKQYEQMLFAQQGLYFMERLNPGGHVFNIPVAARLTGELNVEALYRAVKKIISRHEALRTRFSYVGGEVMQEVVEESTLTFAVTDLAAMEASDREREAKRLIEAESRASFDLEEGPLVRLRIIRLTEQEHLAVLVIHHIVSDGWSMGIFITELATLYEAYSQGQEIELNELAAQYADYTAWQKEWMQGESLERELSYWRRQLGEQLPVLKLPTDRPRPAVQRYEGRQLKFRIGDELTRRLRLLSRQQEATMYMVLLAAFETMLHQYTSQETMLIGTPVANRNRVETESLIGFFVNTLVMKAEVKAEESFIDVLRKVKETALGAYAHQDLPFERLVEELRPERDLSRTPVFQVMFSMQNIPLANVELRGLSIEGEEIPAKTAKYDLTMIMAEETGALEGRLEYRIDLYDEATIDRMARHFEALLEAIAANADVKIRDLPSLPQTERMLTFSQETLPDYMDAPEIRLVENASLTRASGSDSQAMVEDGNGAQKEFTAPRTATEIAVAEVWKEVLELSEINVRDKFFDIGGDSLKMVRVLLLLNQSYPNALTVVDLFKYNTIAEISSYLEQNCEDQLVEPAIEGFEL